ncbi:MAG: CHAD domain-containing protein, partial [Bacteroidales bacterium]
AYYFKKGEPAGSAVKRIASEQINKALASIRQEDAHEAVHDVRKRLKKVRALLRLVRYDTGKEFYKKSNVYYRDLGRMLSPLRDARTQVETLGQLRRDYASETTEQWEIHVPSWIAEKEKIVIRQKLENENVLEQVRNELEQSIKSIDNWPVSEKTDFGVIYPGLNRVYKRGYKGFAKAYDTAGDKNFHEFRKRVKYLWYHINLLKLSWGPVLKRWARETHQLADDLGDDHDLTVLKATLAELPSIGSNPEHPVNRIIRSESDKFRTSAGILAGRIYHEKPKRFTKRMAKYWDMWQEERDTD